MSIPLLNINAADIAAYIGAAAWAPQIYNFFTKPVITITPDKTVSIGYTTFGPIFNLRLSVNVDIKDTLIDFIGLELCHQSGSKYEFEWTGMTEFFSEVKNNNGENQIIQRDIVPISVKLSTLSLTERFFRFRDSQFIKSSKLIIDKLFEEKQYMQSIDKNYHDNFLKCKEFEKYMKFMRENFWWQAGVYKVNFYVCSPARVKFRKHLFEFELTQDNIDLIKNNLSEIKTDIEFLIKKPDIVDFTGNFGNWRWLSIALNKVMS